MNASSLASCRALLRVFRTQFRKIALSCCWGGFIFLLPHIASAATYTVTNTADFGAGSLRDAINQVNGGAGGDTINFSGVTGTIMVTSQLTISQQVTINGPVANILAISGGDTTRVFYITAANTVISGLEITHGNATVSGMSQGAGIMGAAGLIVNNCTF
ncbi:MAG TPA: hypothetical protein VL495_08165, partial [Edaphobacter sp.]|nr:hypothetical protein [Edaphobacter sp.]